VGLTHESRNICRIRGTGTRTGLAWDYTAVSAAYLQGARQLHPLKNWNDAKLVAKAGYMQLEYIYQKLIGAKVLSCDEPETLRSIQPPQVLVTVKIDQREKAQILDCRSCAFDGLYSEAIVMSY